LRKAAPIEGSRPNDSGRIAPSSARPRCSSGSTASWPSLDRLWRPMGILLSARQAGITSRRRPLAIFWRWCGAICGAILVFPHPPWTQLSFYCLVRRSHSWLMRCATEQKCTKSSLSLTVVGDGAEWAMRSPLAYWRSQFCIGKRRALPAVRDMRPRCSYSQCPVQHLTRDVTLAYQHSAWAQICRVARAFEIAVATLATTRT
jgi:hypothetical protein